jgi:pSer/pThr/pTyr-binding forkhead associated (FHA) protein
LVTVTCNHCGKLQTLENGVCSNCGASLVQKEDFTVSRIEVGGLVTNRLRPTEAFVSEVGENVLHLHILRSSEFVPLGGKGEYIIGRVSEGQSIVPDVDLEPYDAYQAGVSRLHARIRLTDQGMSITDLGSSNGTRVNNKRLKPHLEHPLTHKDIVRLGRLSVEAVVLAE